MSIEARRPPLLTADDYFAIPGELPHIQLIDGELVVTSPRFEHQAVIAHLLASFARHLEEHPGAGTLCFDVDTYIDDRNVYRPDVWWVPVERRPRPDQARFDVPPPLVAEVRSPSTWQQDVGTKLRGYERAGAEELWLIDLLHDVVRVHRRGSAGSSGFDLTYELAAPDVLATPLVPGWDVDLAGLFAAGR